MKRHARTVTIIIIAVCLLMIAAVAQIALVFNVTSAQIKQSGADRLVIAGGELEDTINDAKLSTMRFAIELQPYLDNRSECEAFIRSKKREMAETTGSSCFNVYAASADWDYIPDYHDVYSQHYIINEIETCKATQFDPGFADIMLQMIAEDKEYTLREHSGQTKQDSPQPAEKGFISIFKLLEASGICVQNGMKYCMDDAEMYLEMLDEFVKSADMRIEKLRFSYQNMDHPQYQNTVHALKSAAKTVGADHLSALAADLEDAVKHNQIDFRQHRTKPA